MHVWNSQGGTSGEKKRKGPAAAAAPKEEVRKPPKVCTVTVSAIPYNPKIFLEFQ